MPYLLCVSKAALCPVIVIQACTVSGNGPQCFPIFGMFVELVRWGGGVVGQSTLVISLQTRPDPLLQMDLVFTPQSTL